MLTKRLIPTFFIILLLIANSASAADGDVKWSYTTGSRILSSPAIANDGTIYIGSWDSYLYALYPDGSLKWRFETGHQVGSSPAIASDGSVYFGSNDGKLYALNSDGTLKWSYQTGDDVHSPAIGGDGTIYVGSEDTFIYAINPNGSLKWSYETDRMVSGSPAVAIDGTIYSNSDDEIIALNPDGSLKWSYDTDFYIGSSAAIGADGSIYIGSFDGMLYALDPDGNFKWEYRLADIQGGSAVIAKDGTIYIGGQYDNRLTAINPDGSQKWTILTIGGVNYAPALASDGTIYFGSQDGTFYAVNPEDGSTKWTYKTGIGMFSSPAIAPDGTVYIGSSDKKLYAFEGSAGLMNSPWPKLGRNNRKTGSQLDDTGDDFNAFSQTMVESKSFLVDYKTRETWLPNGPSIYRFLDNKNLVEEQTPITGRYATAPQTWSIDNGDIVISHEPSIGYYPIGSDNLIELFGAYVGFRLESLRDSGALPDDQIGVTTTIVETWTQLTRSGNNLEVDVQVETTYDLILPEDVSIFGYKAAVEQSEYVYEMFDLSLITSELSAEDMLGSWVLSLKYDLTLYGFRDFSGFMADLLLFSDDGSVTAEISNKVLDWSIEDGTLIITDVDRRYEIKSFFKQGSQYIVHTSVYVDNVFSEEYAELISKFDTSRTTFTENLVTELPLVINSDISASSEARWEKDVRIFEYCCFAHQFSSNGDMLFGIYNDTDTDPDKPQFNIPELISSYSIVDEEIIIRRNLGSDLRYGIRTWQPISVDEFGRAYVLEREVRFDSNLGENDEQTGAGYLIRPRINIFSTLDLSVYEEEYANSTLPQADNDNDGIPDATDPDDDNDGVEDGADAFPLNIAASIDTDGDGKPDEFNSSCDQACISASGLELDTDDDDDGVLDVDDAYPLDPTKWSDDNGVRHDVDGDGKSDILWRSVARGWNFLWTMNGTATKDARPINVVQGEGWSMDGQGDYDGDGKSDIFWRNSLTGQNFIYLMDGTSIKARATLNYVTAPDWAVKANGDFNGDGKGDVMWRRVDRGDTWFYMMNGLQIGTNRPSLWVTDLNYEIAGAGDINGDGTDDVLWRNKVTGINYIWIMQNGQIANRYTLNAINADWTVAGLGDLDGDGTDDIILRNQVDGRNWAYMMEDGQIRESVMINQVASLDWQIANMGDYDGDGKTDFMWRNETTSQNIVHLMDGNTIKDRGVLRPTDTSWTLAK